MDQSRTVLTPSELNHEARLRLEAGFGRVWVEGEITDLSRPASGHLYFSLKDEKAQLRCALFRSSGNTLSFRPENGQQVQARGRVTLYEPRGSFQMIVEMLEEAGEGRLRARFEALKRKLENEGLFATERKQPLPVYPMRIVVITSPGGAVIRDIINVLKRRWPLARVRLYPVSVQGDSAVSEIVSALGAANRHAWGDAIILARGGGSLEDLVAFNDESVARAVFGSGIPVISAVGHETDFSISDFVADLRAPTPSAAAELLGPDYAQLCSRFRTFETRLARAQVSRLQMLQQSQDHLSQRLTGQHPGKRIEGGLHMLSQLSARVAAFGRQLLPERRSRLAAIQARLEQRTARLLQEQQSRLRELSRTLHAVSPLPTLARGYAVLTDSESKRVLSSATQFSPGQRIRSQLHDGRVYSTVERVSGGALDAETEDD